MRRGTPKVGNGLRRALVAHAQQVHPGAHVADAVDHVIAKGDGLKGEHGPDGYHYRIGRAIIPDRDDALATFVACQYVFAILSETGRTRVAFVLAVLQHHDTAPQRHATASLVAVDRLREGSPPTGVRAVAALCSAPRPGPLAALAA